MERSFRRACNSFHIEGFPRERASPVRPLVAPSLIASFRILLASPRHPNTSGVAEEAPWLAICGQAA